MKNIYLILLLFFAGLSLKAQPAQVPPAPQGGSSPAKHEPVNPEKDKQIVEGFTVQLLPAIDGSYSFHIIKGDKLVYLQTQNPFTMRVEGFEKKDDAFNVAKWMIKEYRITKQFPQFVPPHVAQELNINIHKPEKENQN